MVISPHTGINTPGFTASWGALPRQGLPLIQALMHISAPENSSYISDCDQSDWVQHPNSSLWDQPWAAGTCLSPGCRALWDWDSLARALVTGRLKLWPTSAHTALGQSTQRQTGRRRPGSPPEDVNDPGTKKQARDKQRKTNWQQFPPNVFHVSES